MYNPRTLCGGYTPIRRKKQHSPPSLRRRTRSTTEAQIQGCECDLSLPGPVIIDLHLMPFAQIAADLAKNASEAPIPSASLSKPAS